jgi:bacterioferritin-associated ferredoxin
LELPVTRCVCMELEFAELQRLAHTMSMDFEALRAWSACCTGCGTCEPYVRLMLETGATAFAVLSPADAAAVISRGRAAAQPYEKGPPKQAAP